VGESHGLFLVLALAVSASEAIRLVVQAPFQRSLRCGLLLRPVRKEVFLLLFSMGQESAEVGWDCFVEQGVPWFFEGWARAFTYPM
jgi:hypothetical protein